jgi:hypothetical protein
MKKQYVSILLLMILFGGIVAFPKLIQNNSTVNSFSNSFPVRNSLFSKIKVLYLYNSTNSYYCFDAYKTLFASSDEIALNGINVSEFVKDVSVSSGYHVLIVGVSAFGYYTDANASRANAIVSAKKPVLALGHGGGTFFESLGYGYGGGSMGFSCAGLNVNQTDANHALFSQKYSFAVPGNITINGTSNNNVKGIYMGNPFPNTEYLARGINNKRHAPLAENTGFMQKMLYLGFNFAPTAQGSLYMLVHNCIEYLAGPPSQISVQITNPTNHSTIISSNTSVNISFSYVGDLDLIQAELFIDDAPYPSGPITKPLSGVSGSAFFQEVDLGSSVIWEDGWHTLTIVVTDNSSWNGHSTILFNRNEFVGPILTLLSPANESDLDQITTFSIGVYSDYLDYLDYYLDGVYQSRYLDIDGFYDDVFSLPLDVTSWSSGQHKLRFVAVGHPTDTASLLVYVNVVLPEPTTTTTEPTTTTTEPPTTSEPQTTTTPPDTSTTPPDSSTTPDTSDTSLISSSSEETSIPPSPTLSATPGFTTIIIIMAFLIVIPLNRIRKRS